MGEQMLSWHKPGQKVAVVDGHVWRTSACALTGRPVSMPKHLPGAGQIYTISEVRRARDNTLLLVLVEMSQIDGWNAAYFRPVYPQIIDSLRSVDAPINHHEVEHV